MRNQSIRIRVDPEFHKKLKIAATKKDCSIIKLTKKLSKKNDPFELFKNEKDFIL